MPEWTVERRFPARSDHVVVRARQGDGRPVVLKATAPGAGWRDRARLRHEARLLDLARGPGVVDLLDVIDTRGRTTLVLGFVPLTAPDPRPDLSTVVERLGRLGIVHGAIRGDHLLLTADGEPVLCGFGQARLTQMSGS